MLISVVAVWYWSTVCCATCNVLVSISQGSHLLALFSFGFVAQRVLWHFLSVTSDERTNVGIVN